MNDLTQQLRTEAGTLDAYCGRDDIDALLGEAADRIEQLEAFVVSLDIETMHPDMGGAHQCKVRASGTKLTVDQWRIVDSCLTWEVQP